MSDYYGRKELARQQIFDLKCVLCEDVPGSTGVRKNRYVCLNGHLICELCRGHFLSEDTGCIKAKWTK